MGQNEIQMNKLLVIFFAFVSNHLDETGKENQESSWCEFGHFEGFICLI